MRALIALELRKAIRSPLFALALAVGVALAAASFAGTVAERLPQYRSLLVMLAVEPMEKFASPSIYSCFNQWMSVDGWQVTTALFYKVAPLLAVMPYAWSLLSERRSGYVCQVFVRQERWRYALAKALAAFCAGGLVATVPQLLNLVALACVFPGYTPEVTTALYTGIYEDNLWSGLFYSYPAAYAGCYLVLDFALCGLWAAFVLCLGFFVRNPLKLLAVPYLVLLAVQFVNERIFLALGGIRGIQLSLLENLPAYTTAYVQNGWVILAEALALAVAAALLVAVGVRRDAL